LKPRARGVMRSHFTITHVENKATGGEVCSALLTLSSAKVII